MLICSDTYTKEAQHLCSFFPIHCSVLKLLGILFVHLQRRVQHVAKENEFYMQLINLALPPETNNHTEATERSSSRGMVFEILS